MWNPFGLKAKLNRAIRHLQNAHTFLIDSGNFKPNYRKAIAYVEAAESSIRAGVRINRGNIENTRFFEDSLKDINGILEKTTKAQKTGDAKLREEAQRSNNFLSSSATPSKEIAFLKSV